MLTRQLLNHFFLRPSLVIQQDANAGGETTADILARASERARQAAIEYIGLVTPQEAMRLMEAAAARLVDVRTPTERARAGHVPRSVPIAWRARGEDAADPRFVAQLRRRVKPSEVVVFLSRNGRRSHRAARAAAAAGYVHALSVLEGFDGERVGTGGRRTRGGWRREQAMRGAKQAVETALDEALIETFPASDPIPIDRDADAAAARPDDSASRARE